jgi:hypothetical protein
VRFPRALTFAAALAFALPRAAPAQAFAPEPSAITLERAAAAAAEPGGPQEQAALQKVRDILSRGGGILPQDKAFLEEWTPRFFAAGLLGRAPTNFERITIEGWFPKLAAKGDWRVTGEACATYNCIAWSVGVVGRWLWPSDDAAAFDGFYSSYGYVPLAPGESADKADVAFWVSADGEATHGCRRVAGELWESKLGSSLRILHRLDELEGATYGRPVKLYRRATAAELGALGVAPLPPDSGGSDPCAALGSLRREGPLKSAPYDIGSPRSDRR